jgi:hypothetical protein
MGLKNPILTNLKNYFMSEVLVPQVGDDVRGFNHKYGTSIKDVNFEKREFKIKHSDYWDSSDIWVSFDSVVVDSDGYTWRKIKVN